jgi:Fe-S-cluster-containing hydrogenase component 2
LCAKKCPVGAVSGEKKQVHTIDREKCIQCGICYEVCKKKTIRLIDPADVATHRLKEEKEQPQADESERV